MTLLVPLPLLSLFACKAPPPAPKGLDNSAAYLLREFYADDASIGAGVTGFMDWFDADGDELLNKRADLNNVGAFTLSTLSWDEVGHLPLDDDGRVPNRVSGVVAIAEIRCSWRETEALFAREDQAVVFEDDYDWYRRTYLSDRNTFENAGDSEEIAVVREPIAPWETDYTIDAALEEAFLLTTNRVQTTQAGITIEADLELSLRHGIVDVQGEMTPVSLVTSFAPEGATGDNENNQLLQQYSVLVNIPTGPKRTIRMFALWAEIDTTLFSSDSNLFLSAAVNGAQDAAERVSDICSGEITIPRE